MATAAFDVSMHVKNTFVHFVAPRKLRAVNSCPDLQTRSTAEEKRGTPFEYPSFSVAENSDVSSTTSTTEAHSPERCTNRSDGASSASTSPEHTLQGLEQMGMERLAQMPSQDHQAELWSPHAAWGNGDPTLRAALAMPSFSQSHDREQGGYCFNFKLRQAGTDTGLGVKADHSTCGNYLIIKEVLEEGVLVAWNRQCNDGSKAALKAVVPGDVLEGINSASTCDTMIQECKQRLLLDIRVFRSFDVHSTNFSGVPLPWQS